MEHCGSGTPQPANEFKMADWRMKLQETQLPLDVAQHCSVLVFPLQKFLCWKFHDFLFRNKAFVCFTYFKKNCSNITQSCANRKKSLMKTSRLIWCTNPFGILPSYITNDFFSEIYSDLWWEVIPRLCLALEELSPLGSELCKKTYGQRTVF